MSNSIIQAEYDKLDDIAERFAANAEATTDTHSRLENTVHALQNGKWEGEGSTAFFAEMNQAIFPTMTRLAGALEQAQSVTLQVKAILQAAEEEAARLFGGEADGTSVSGHTKGDNSDPDPIGADGLFSKSYMDDMVGTVVKGTGDPRLIDAMRTLSGNASPEEISNALDKISAARGVPRDQIQADYDRYLKLRAKATGDWEPLDEKLHPNFMGSTVQLRFGQTVGDALDIDPVFGSMLSPTGGLVGPSNYAAQFPDEHPVSYHGVFHDAAGYLRNNHSMGPGYDYMGLESSRDNRDPFTGQETGIAYWNKKMGVGGFEAKVTNGTGAILGEIVDIKHWARESTTAVKKEFNEIADTAGEVVDNVQDGFNDIVDWVF